MQGELLDEKLVVPRLRVRKNWFEGLADEPIDTTHPDVGANPDAQDGEVPKIGLLLTTHVPSRSLRLL